MKRPLSPLFLVRRGQRTGDSRQVENCCGLKRWVPVRWTVPSYPTRGRFRLIQREELKVRRSHYRHGGQGSWGARFRDGRDFHLRPGVRSDKSTPNPRVLEVHIGDGHHLPRIFLTDLGSHTSMKTCTFTD